MKKKQIIALLISLALSLGILFICAYIALDRSFPMAGPIPLPTEETITSIICGHQSDLLLTVEPARYAELLQMLSTAQPTRKMSVNDYPDIRPFSASALIPLCGNTGTIFTLKMARSTLRSHTRGYMNPISTFWIGFR